MPGHVAGPVGQLLDMVGQEGEWAGARQCMHCPYSVCSRVGRWEMAWAWRWCSMVDNVRGCHTMGGGGIGY